MSMEQAQREDGGYAEIMVEIPSRDGREKDGRGCGDRQFSWRRSAMKAAFSADLGRRKARKLVVDGMLEGRGRMKLSCANFASKAAVEGGRGREKRGSVGVWWIRECGKSGGTKRSQIWDGIG